MKKTLLMLGLLLAFSGVSFAQNLPDGFSAL